MPTPSRPRREPTLDRRRFLQVTAAAGAVPVLGTRSVAIADAPAARPYPYSESAVQATTPAGPDVGTLFPFIEKQAVHGQFPLSFLQPSAAPLDTWKPATRARVLSLLHYAPPPCDPAAETLERVDCGDYVRERVAFNTTPDVRVPAFVLVPKGRQGRLPAIVALHDHGGFYLWGKEKLVAIDGEHPVLAGFRTRSYGGRSIAIELVRRGYVVVVIDMFYWGDRRMLLADDPADWRDRPASMPDARVDAFNARASSNEQLVGRTIYSAGFTWPGVMCWDDIRTVDYLLTRPDVDPKRIGCVGLSVGAVRSTHLAAFDDRIRAAVVVCWMTSFPRQLRSHIRNTIGHTKVIPGVQRLLDYPDVASLAMPTPMLVMSGSRDALFALDGIKESLATLEACYAKAGIAERCRTRLYDSPHQFSVEMQAEAWAWLERFV
jgi:dienelactone hydrolase